MGSTAKVQLKTVKTTKPAAKEAKTTAKPAANEVKTVPMTNNEKLRINLNVKHDLDSGRLSCPRTQNTCDYIVNDEGSTIGDLMHRYGLKQEALTGGEAGQINKFKPEKENFTKLPINEAKGFFNNLFDKLFGSIVSINQNALEEPVYNVLNERYKIDGSLPY